MQTSESEPIPEVKCTYQTHSHICGEEIYSCWITDKEIPKNNILKFVGKHEEEKSNADVVELQFVSCLMKKVPSGLTEIFPNLKMLSFYDSKLETLTKNDLIEYKNLKCFTCQDSNIKFLPADLFEDFENLEFINFYRNELVMIEPNILNELTKSKHVDFRKNSNYYSFYSRYPKMDPNSTLEEVKNELSEKYRTTPKILKNLINSDIKTGLFSDIKDFMQDETTKDFWIQIDDYQFPVHKFLLAARSPTLAEILKNNPEVEKLNLVDISVEIFEKILKFLYTDELPGDDGTNFLHLFAAAGKLKIGQLKEFAAKKLFDQIDENNAMDVLILSNKYEHEELRRKSFKIIKQKYPKVAFKDEWSVNTDKMIKVIEIIKQKEEAERKMQEDLEKI
jgi:hypothetical protein